jgi:transposase
MGKSLTPETLPDDVDTLKEMVVLLAGKLDEATKRIYDQDLIVRRFSRQLFGQKSERLLEGEQILSGFGNVHVETEPETAPQASTKKQPVRPKEKRKRFVVPPDIPERVRVLEIAEKDLPCPDCGEIRRPMGEDRSWKLEYQPGSFYKDVLVKKKYSCRKCQANVLMARPEHPHGPIEGGIPGPGLLAHVVVSKYCDHRVPSNVCVR